MADVDRDDIVAALANALGGALEARDGRIAWQGAYDHGNPPSCAEIADSVLPRLERQGYVIRRDERQTARDGRVQSPEAHL